jgi:hypothetical protein
LLSVTASLGITDYNKDISCAVDFFKGAVYEAKALDRNQVYSLIYLADQ